MIVNPLPESWPPLAEAGGGGSRLLTRDVLADETPRPPNRPVSGLWRDKIGEIPWDAFSPLTEAELREWGWNVDSVLSSLLAVAHDPTAYADLLARLDFSEEERFIFGTPERLRYMLDRLAETVPLTPGERVLGPDDFP